MSDTYYYNPVEASQISSALAKAFEGMNKDGEKYLKNGSVNTFIVVSAGYDQAQFEDVVLTLTQVHPNRIFVIVIDETQKEAKAEFSTRCHAVAKGEHVCSEVVRLTANHQSLPAVLSIVRANLLTGKPSELYVYDNHASLESIDTFSSLSEQIIYSTRLFEGDLDQADLLLITSKNLVDLEWIRLGIWRDQIKDIFENTHWQQNLSQIAKITITSQLTKGSSAAASVDALLIVGWIMDRLALRVVGTEKGDLTLRGIKGSKILNNEIALVFSSSTSEVEHDQLGKLQIDFSSADCSSSSWLVLSREKLLKTTLHLDQEYTLSRPFEDESDIGLIKRYFFIGESTINYRNSLSNAMEVAKRIK